MPLRCPLLALCVVAVAAGACEAPGGGDTIEPDGKISTNGLVLDVAALSELDTAALGARWHSESELVAAPEHVERLAATPKGRELLRYVAYCALPAAESLIVDGPDGIEAMHGLVGLAPAWSDAPCDEGCQRWVSACLLAHANGRHEPVSISLRGEHPELAWSEEIEDEFDVEEAAYYGNVFAASPEMYACVGRGLFDGSWAGQTSYLEGRICGLSGHCGLQSTGTCHSLTGDGWLDSGTCERGGEGGEAYGDCRAEVGNQDAPAYAEVVTVYLAR